MMQDVDAILLVVDAASGLGKGDKYILENLKNNNIPVILVLNKIDQLKREQIMESIIAYKDLYPFCEIVPVSALKKDNMERLLEVIICHLWQVNL